MYTFALEKVLNHRKKAEELAQERLAGAVRDTQQARCELELTEQALSSCQNTYTAFQTAGINLAQLMQASDYAGKLTAQAQTQKMELTQKEVHLLQEKRQAEKAMQDRKAMDILREKDLARYHHRINLQEQQQTDEIARTVYLRRQDQS